MNILLTIFTLLVSLSAFAGEDQLRSWSHDPDNISLFLHTDCDNYQFLEDSLFTHLNDTPRRKRLQPEPQAIHLSEFSYPDSFESPESAKRQCLAKLAAEIFSSHEAYFSTLVERQNISEMHSEHLADEDLNLLIDCARNDEALPHTPAENTHASSYFLEQHENTSETLLTSQDDIYMPGINMSDAALDFFSRDVDYTFNLSDASASSTTLSPGSSYPSIPSMPAHTEKPYTCSHIDCAKTFHTSTHLNTHMRNVHSAERPYLCPYPRCTSTFKSPSQMSEHMRNLHSDDRPYACTHSGCSKSFKSLSHLNEHLRNMHTTQKPYVCDEINCATAFKTRSSLKVHKRFKHSDEKPYKCTHPNCERAFKSPSDRNRHLHNVHNKDIA